MSSRKSLLSDCNYVPEVEINVKELLEKELEECHAKMNNIIKKAKLNPTINPPDLTNETILLPANKELHKWYKKADIYHQRSELLKEIIEMKSLEIEEKHQFNKVLEDLIKKK